LSENLFDLGSIELHDRLLDRGRAEAFSQTHRSGERSDGGRAIGLEIGDDVVPDASPGSTRAVAAENA
jgi:hypothetical protein